MTIAESSHLRSKINAVAGVLPGDTSAAFDELVGFAEEIYDLDAQDAARRLRPVIDEVWDRAQRRGPVPAGFPNAKSARQSLYELETALDAEMSR